MACNIIFQEHIVKRNEILDMALRLVYTQDYPQMTIQGILGVMHISKGAFYHYFDSKPSLLEALVERMVVDELMPLLIPIIRESLPVPEKLHKYFYTASSWKLAQKTFMLELLRVWYTDENAIVRQKLFTMSIKWVTPLLTEIIRQCPCS